MSLGKVLSLSAAHLSLARHALTLILLPTNRFVVIFKNNGSLFVDHTEDLLITASWAENLSSTDILPFIY